MGPILWGIKVHALMLLVGHIMTPGISWNGFVPTNMPKVPLFLLDYVFDKVCVSNGRPQTTINGFLLKNESFQGASKKEVPLILEIRVFCPPPKIIR